LRRASFMAFPLAMPLDDDTRESDTPIATTLSSTLGMLAGRWHERRPLKSAGFGMSADGSASRLHQIHGRGHAAVGPSLPICDVRSSVANGGEAEVLVTFAKGRD